MKIKNLVAYTAVFIIFVGMGYAFYLYKKAFSENTRFNQEEVFVHIPTGSSYEDVSRILKNYVKDFESFETFATKFEFDQKVVPGRFRLTKGMNNYRITQAMRRNIPVRITFNNQETIGHLAGRLSKQIEPDSLTILHTLTDEKFISEAGFNKENVLSMFLPNTFEFYWHVSPLKLRNTLHREYIKFWNAEREQKAKDLGLTPIEVSILASIVQKETVKVDERPKVARAYLNRLNKNMLLQADPTVVYSKKLLSNDWEQVIKRVYLKDLNLNSPFNTYMYNGLPPGPITMPDVSSIDAVLNPETHDYIYFCASVDRLGYHEFAKTLEEHHKNRDRYVAWLNKQGIE